VTDDDNGESREKDDVTDATGGDRVGNGKTATSLHDGKNRGVDSKGEMKHIETNDVLFVARMM